MWIQEWSTVGDNGGIARIVLAKRLGGGTLFRLGRKYPTVPLGAKVDMTVSIMHDTEMLNPVYDLETQGDVTRIIISDRMDHRVFHRIVDLSLAVMLILQATTIRVIE